MGEILKYIEANLLETNDVRELLSGLEETLNGIGSSSDKALLKTKLSLGLSDCYLIMEGTSCSERHRAIHPIKY